MVQLFQLSFNADIFYAAVVAGMIEKLAVKEGLTEIASSRLSLGTEEVVAYLSNKFTGKKIDVEAAKDALGVQVRFSLPELFSDLHVFNLSTNYRPILDEESNFNRMGLYLAARFADGFSLELKNQRIEMTLKQGYEFETIHKMETIPQYRGQFSIADSNYDTVTDACASILNRYKSDQYASVVHTPEKLWAYMQEEIFRACSVKDEAGNVAGFLYWENLSNKSANFYGPYLFADDKETIAELLFKHMFETIAKSSLFAVFNGIATSSVPSNFFEKIMIDEARLMYYRQLNEEVGMVVRTPSILRQYLEGFYEKLLLIRDIVVVDGYNKSDKQECSLFGIDFDKINKAATIIPLVDGKDATANIESHINYLRSENYSEIYARFDLFYAWQAILAALFYQNGFQPYLVKPYAGQSDILIMKFYE
ncbi:MAG: hypothetical protein ACOC4Y_01340 [bacterium]